MRAIVLTITAVLLLSVAGTGQGLHELRATAEHSNPSLIAALARYDALKARAKQQGYLEDPKIGAGYFLQSVETRVGPQRATISISQMFPWFGTLDAREKSAGFMADAAYQQYLDERNRVFYELSAVYNSMYSVKKSDAALFTHTQWLRALKDILTSRYENGRSGLSDVLRIEMELQTVTTRRQEFIEKATSLHARIEELTGEGLGGEIEFPDTLPLHPPIPEETVIETMRSGNPVLGKYEQLTNAWEQSARAARNMGLPSITLGATYTIIDGREDVILTDNGKDAIIAPQIGISLPIYRGKYSAMEDEALRQQEAVLADREAMLRRLETRATEAIEAMRNAFRHTELYRNLAQLSEKTRDIVLEEYTNAQKGIDDVIQVERQYIEYQLKLEQARAEYNTGVAHIEYLTGRQGMTHE